MQNRAIYGRIIRAGTIAVSVLTLVLLLIDANMEVKNIQSGFEILGTYMYAFVTGTAAVISGMVLYCLLPYFFKPKSEKRTYKTILFLFFLLPAIGCLFFLLLYSLGKIFHPLSMVNEWLYVGILNLAATLGEMICWIIDLFPVKTNSEDIAISIVCGMFLLYYPVLLAIYCICRRIDSRKEQTA